MNAQDQPAGRPIAARTLHGSLFLLLLFSLPAPFFLQEFALVPPARMLQLSGHMLYLLAAERAVFASVIIGLAFILQGLFFTLLCLWLARLGAPLLRARGRRITALLAAALWLAAASSYPLYSDPFLPDTSAATLRTVYH